MIILQNHEIELKYFCCAQIHHHINDHNNDNPQATAHCEKLFRLIDIDGDGNLTEAEFLRVELDFIIIYSLSYHTS